MAWRGSSRGSSRPVAVLSIDCATCPIAAMLQRMRLVTDARQPEGSHSRSLYLKKATLASEVLSVVVGYKLSAHDDTHTMLGDGALSVEPSIPADLYRNRHGSSSLLCSACGRKLDSSWINPGYRVGRRSRDACTTYDGYFLVSRRFRDAWESSGHEGAIFDRLPSDPEFFALRSNRRVSFDAVSRGTQFDDYCSSCRSYATVVGATPVRLVGVHQPLAPGLYRTDLEFACGIEQHPLLLVGVETHGILRPARLKGLEFSEIFA